MKAKVGLWIDHREAFIVVLTEKGEETKRIESTVEKQLRRSGRSPSNESFEPQLVPADDTRERDYMGHLANYYDEVIACIGDAETILIFGPGEAKGELKKRMERDKIGIRIVDFPASDFRGPRVGACWSRLEAGWSNSCSRFSIRRRAGSNLCDGKRGRAVPLRSN
jgi:hypothetical protein